MTIKLSDGTSYEAVLVVYRDFLESNGRWRLFWQNPADGNGVPAQSTVTDRWPFYRTRWAAVAYGERRWGITAERGHGFAGDIG